MRFALGFHRQKTPLHLTVRGITSTVQWQLRNIVLSFNVMHKRMATTIKQVLVPAALPPKVQCGEHVTKLASLELNI
jgi:hypothetical protein